MKVSLWGGSTERLNADRIEEAVKVSGYADAVKIIFADILSCQLWGRGGTGEDAYSCKLVSPCVPG